MHVDPQTLKDLEIFETATREPGMIGHLDRTRTRGGREILRRRLTRPLSTVVEIDAVQAALRYIASNRTLFDALPDESLLGPLHRYLDSRFVTLKRTAGPSVALESLWIRLRHKDLYEEAASGVALVEEFLARIAKLITALRELPPLLRERMDRMEIALAAPPVLELLRPRRRFQRTRDVLFRDGCAREAGRVALRTVIEMVQHIDALISMADVTTESGYTYPVITEESGVLIEGMRHPFLDDAVPNDLALQDGARLVFLTGPNTAGKTTYLKACGVVALLAHVGMGVPAARCRMGVLDRLITGIRTEDSLRSGISYFQAEARRVRDIARSLLNGERCMVLVDELFRGTNVKDAYDASLRVITAFAASPRGSFVIASHLIELANELEHVPGVVLTKFQAQMVDGDVEFDYRATAGVSGQRLGLEVLEQEGVLSALARMQGEWPVPADDA
jgi:DNA mismatch repair ATPase MutS